MVWGEAFWIASSKRARAKPGVEISDEGFHLVSEGGVAAGQVGGRWRHGSSSFRVAAGLLTESRAIC
jgi:hypothetical protein